MKKQISYVVIGLMIITGLVLALPFSQFRKSIPVFDSINKIFVGVDAHINTMNNVSIAQTVNELILSADSYAEVKAIISGAQKSVVDNGSVVANSDSGIPVNVLSPEVSGNIFVGENNPPLLVQSGTQSVTNFTMDKTSYRMNMTSTTLVNNRNSRLMAMSGNANSEASAAQGAVRQMAGGAPPPSEDEIVPPIGTLPIGDGSGFMLLLMILFGMFKVRKLIV